MIFKYYPIFCYCFHIVKGTINEITHRLIFLSYYSKTVDNFLLHGKSSFIKNTESSIKADLPNKHCVKLVSLFL